VSWSLNLFVDTQFGLEELAEELGRLLGRKSELTFNSDESLYELCDQSWCLSAGRHDLVNDRDMKFETFPYQISIWSTSYPDWKVSQATCHELANSLFDKFKTAGYRLLLTENLQHKLRCYRKEIV